MTRKLIFRVPLDLGLLLRTKDVWFRVHRCYYRELVEGLALRILCWMTRRLGLRWHSGESNSRNNGTFDEYLRWPPTL